MVTEHDVRRAALALPSTTEKPSYGTPGFRVRDRLFARLRPEGDSVVIWCADLGEKDGLIASEPEKFFTTPHYDGHPTVLVRMSAVDGTEMAELLAESWRVRAPAKLVAEFDRPG
ncbi:MAG TPA: MmcQ/YjbR family DNA-binding protein [Acidimicrobiales bacterium]|nr:MmcQ/YjbR family DNA-binding protein [Acidimicrobiales bacterium]